MVNCSFCKEAPEREQQFKQEGAPGLGCSAHEGGSAESHHGCGGFHDTSSGGRRAYGCIIACGGVGFWGGRGLILSHVGGALDSDSFNFFVQSAKIGKTLPKFFGSLINWGGARRIQVNLVNEL